jgi:cytochrome c-type biogenesis protein CcmH/NrfG
MVEKSGNGSVKKETMVLIALVALVAGFLGGIVFSVFNSGSGSSVQSSGTAGPQQQAPGLTSQQASSILSLEKEVAANPDNVNAWTELGHVYYDTENFSKAIRAYEKSLALQPSNPDVLTDLGVMYRGNGQFEEAVKRFDMAMALNPNHQQSRFNKGVVLKFDLNDTAGALKAWNELLAINPNATMPNGQPLSEAIKTLTN